MFSPGCQEDAGDSGSADESMVSPGCEAGAGDSGSDTQDSDSDTEESRPSSSEYGSGSEAADTDESMPSLCERSDPASGSEAGDDDSDTDSEAVDDADSGSEAGDVKSTVFGKTGRTAGSAASSDDANADDAALSSEGSDMSVWEDHIRRHGPGQLGLVVGGTQRCVQMSLGCRMQSLSPGRLSRPLGADPNLGRNGRGLAFEAPRRFGISRASLGDSAPDG